MKLRALAGHGVEDPGGGLQEKIPVGKEVWYPEKGTLREN